MKRSIPALVVLVFGLSAVPAQAAVPHTVQPGETLWSIAAANNFTTRALAAANGLSEDAQVVLGSTVMIPSEGEAAAALGSASPTAPAGTAAQPAAPAPPPLGAYTVRPGDTLSGLAAGAGVSVEQIAAMNGLDPSAALIAGTPLKLPTGAPQTQQPQPQPTKPPPPTGPQPTGGRVTADLIGQVAAEHGVSPVLASSVAWQESGFNNAAVSSAGARGVMQVMPGTWQWIQDNLASAPLDPTSPYDNVHAGVMYMQQLLRDTGGDERTATAAYYQGLASVRRIGLLPETERYVASVNAHKPRFGG